MTAGDIGSTGDSGLDGAAACGEGGPAALRDGERAGSFEEAMRDLGDPVRKGAVVREGVAVEGFRGAQFDDKVERARRYGKVYGVFEYGRGYLLRLELPRRVPASQAKAALGVPDEMPDYRIEVRVRGGCLVVHGSIVDPTVRRVAAVSPAFPPDFTTSIALPGPVAAFKSRCDGRLVEVAVFAAA